MYDLSRYVEEVEQVRKALNLNKNNFYLYGHSWGGILAMQYALKYQDNIKGLVISDMMASCPEYGKYADNVLAKQMPSAVLDTIRQLEKKGDFQNPKYMELLMPHFYVTHILRLAEWPEPINRMFGKLNNELYVTMQGPSEFGVSGKLANWDVSKAQGTGFGTQLVALLTKQLDGTMSQEVKNGTVISIAFKRAKTA